MAISELRNGLICGNHCGKDPPVPAVRAEPGDGDRPFRKRFGVVVELGQVDVIDLAKAFAAGTHPAGGRIAGELFGGFAGSAFDGDRATSMDGGHVEGECLGRTDVGLTKTTEQDSQHRICVGDRTQS